LYTTRFGAWESTEIEEKFLGRVDRAGKRAVEYFATFEHPSVDGEAFNALLPYMSIQKLRTPKGLLYLSSLVDLTDRNSVLFRMQELQQLFCAIWTESVWSIVDASQSSTKFIISDHPVSVYNRGCFPASKYCRDLDPDVRMSGTHTIFPLSLDKALILTNLSWVRNPYSNPLKPRPNPRFFGDAMFNFMEIQTKRLLTDREVTEMNLVIKQRARRYIAAAEESWLYPERSVRTRWDDLGDGFLFMPDPRSVDYSTGVMVGYQSGHRRASDEYGRTPADPEYSGHRGEPGADWDSFQAFRGEFARRFGPKRRGRTYAVGRLDNEEDDPEYHRHNLQLESLHKRYVEDRRPRRKRKRRKTR
jgi:hypothetical protein